MKDSILGSYLITINLATPLTMDESSQLINITLPNSCIAKYFITQGIYGGKGSIDSGIADWRMFSC